MFPPESFYVLEQFLKTKPRNLKWVFIELDELEIRRIPQAEASSDASFTGTIGSARR